jgi:2-polyprenyl-6-methoxyphenol hydroxylase-like FAD-dependent oxidoreductase
MAQVIRRMKGGRVMYDAIVVGARCAGASTALLLARRGYRVLLVDRAAFPSDTISGHFILHAGVRQLAAWGLLEQVLGSGCPAIRKVASDWGDGLLVGEVPTADGLPACVGPRRTTLDALIIAAAAEAGVEVREGVVVDGLLSSGGQVTGIQARQRGRAQTRERARLVIGADGKRSTIARLVGAPSYMEQPSLTCWYMSYWADFPCEGLEMHWRESRLVFAFPTHNDLTLLAVAWPRGEFEQFRSNIGDNFRATLARMPPLAERLPAARQAERFVGTADVPNFFRRPYGPGWALVGDAGHHKDPTLARGISDALCDAALLAEAADAGLSGREEMAAAMARYEQRRNARAIPENDANLQAAHLTSWNSPDVMGLRAVLRENPVDAGLFYAARLQVIPPETFFTPENLGRIMERARHRHTSGTSVATEARTRPTTI